LLKSFASPTVAVRTWCRPSNGLDPLYRQASRTRRPHSSPILGVSPGASIREMLNSGQTRPLSFEAVPWGGCNRPSDRLSQAAH
jgi:hypothetical protein